MKKIEVRVLGLSYSQNQAGAYVLVLSEVDGLHKIPIIIKQNDAQYIALKIEGIKSSTPNTHDLIKKIVESLNSDIQEVFIYTITEGLFYSKLILTDTIDEIEIECNIGDAISLSLAFGCPIMVSEDVISISGIQMSDSGIVDENQEIENKKERKSTISVDNLEKMLEKALSDEEYEIASQLRDRINELNDIDINKGI